VHHDVRLISVLLCDPQTGKPHDHETNPARTDKIGRPYYGPPNMCRHAPRVVRVHVTRSSVHRLDMLLIVIPCLKETSNCYCMNLNAYKTEAGNTYCQHALAAAAAAVSPISTSMHHTTSMNQGRCACSMQQQCNQEACEHPDRGMSKMACSRATC
jgi:hypothetical protein